MVAPHCLSSSITPVIVSNGGVRPGLYAPKTAATLFVAPVLVFASLFIGPTLLDLAFPAGLVLMVLLSVLVTGQVAGDGRSDWLKGAQLLAVYLILGLTYFFMPDASSH